MEEFGVGLTASSLGLALYVLGCQSRISFSLVQDEISTNRTRRWNWTNALFTAERVGFSSSYTMHPTHAIIRIPAVGRTTPYLISFTIFVILLIPTSLVDNFAGLLVLRFLLGFFGSPCLATAGATFQDIVSIQSPRYRPLRLLIPISFLAKKWPTSSPSGQLQVSSSSSTCCVHGSRSFNFSLHRSRPWPPPRNLQH